VDRRHHWLVWVHASCCSPSDSEQNTMEREDWRCCCWPRRPIV